VERLSKKYIFIDESGDPVFYGNRKKLLTDTDGFQPYLIIGLIETDNRKALRKVVLQFIDSIKNDPMYNTIPSVSGSKDWYVHARGDHPEIRAKFFELLRNTQGFSAHLAIAKKDLHVFNKKHNNNPTEFYFDVLHHLLQVCVTDNNKQYNLYLSERGSNSLHQFKQAIEKALVKNDKTITCNFEIVSNKEMPELSIIDYLMWAYQRKLLKNESRFFDALHDKYKTLLNLYETI